jgi:hypothetical protein
MAKQSRQPPISIDESFAIVQRFRGEKGERMKEESDMRASIQ